MVRHQTLTLAFGGSNPPSPGLTIIKPPRGVSWVTLIDNEKGKKVYARVAQLVEQRSCKAQVACSSHAAGSKCIQMYLLN